MPKIIEFDGKQHAFPDDFSDADIASALAQANAPKGFMANAADFVKSIPRGLVTGLTSAPNPSLVPTEDEQMAVAPTRQAATQTLKAPLPVPQGPAGRIGEAVGEGVGNPVSYIGPGGPLLKVGGAALSSAASEGAGQATEGTAYEKPARIAAALAGGVVAGKALGPGQPRAAIPTAAELRAAADKGYAAAASSGIVLDPKAVAGWAQTVEQQLNAKGFSGGQRGTAPKTMGALEDLRIPPTGAGVIGITPEGIDALRATLKNIAAETQPSIGGAIVATRDAAAANKALAALGKYTEAIPSGHVLAGDAKAYSSAIKQANGDYGSFARVRDYDARLTKAERATDRQVAGSLDSQIKQKSGQLLDRGAKGLNDAEKAQLELINSGGPVSNTLRQLGRGGAGVIPLMTQAAVAAPLAAATGGASILPQAGVAAALYGARKGSEQITKYRANKLVEMLAKRSPEYEARVKDLPAVSGDANKAAIVRALLAR